MLISDNDFEIKNNMQEPQSTMSKAELRKVSYCRKTCYIFANLFIIRLINPLWRKDVGLE